MLYQLSYASPSHPETTAATGPEAKNISQGVHGHTPAPHTQRHKS